jgi:2',3'-cyclic-nucleotide 2'-phosphodiesterase (5'-nucleotidase family)
MGFWKALKDDLKNTADKIKTQYEYSEMKRGVDKAKDAVKAKVNQQIGYVKAGLNDPGFFMLKNMFTHIASDLTRKVLPNVSDHFYETATRNGQRYMTESGEKIAKELLVMSDADVRDFLIVMKIEKNPRLEYILESLEKAHPERFKRIAGMIEEKLRTQ